MIKNSFEIPSVWNGIIVLLQALCLFVCFMLLPYVQGWSLLVLGCAFAVVMNSVYSTIHEAHHRILFPQRSLNDLVGIIYALFFPAPFHLLRQGHLGHHRKNRSDDEAFDLYFSKDYKIWKFIAWYSILFGFYWILVVASNVILLIVPWLMRPKFWGWDRTANVFLTHFDPKTFTIMQLESLAAVVLHIALPLALGCSWSNYLIMYLCFGWMWSSLQYVHHYQAERDVLNGAHNLKTFRIIDALWLNHNLHKTHHQHPTVPWIYLPSVAAQQSTTSASLASAYFRMWQGPQPALENINRLFDGDVSR